MNTISRVDTAINDHNVAANTIALCLVLFVSVISAVKINQIGNLTTSYDTVFRPASAAQTQADSTTLSKTKTTSLSSTMNVETSNGSVLSSQPQEATGQLQPAQDTISSTQASTANKLQASANTIQVTSANLQNAEITLQ